MVVAVEGAGGAPGFGAPVRGGAAGGAVVGAGATVVVGTSCRTRPSRRLVVVGGVVGGGDCPPAGSLSSRERPTKVPTTATSERKRCDTM